jgi:DNA-binding Lrp family transcriptional regulator
MIKIDATDRKILFHLHEDSRQSLKTIGKKVGISRELSSYRIKRLIKQNIITKFHVNIDMGKFGYGLYNVYFNFKNINPAIKKEIIDYCVDNKLITYVSLLEGVYDFQVECALGDPFEFESMFDKFQEKYRQYLTLIHTISWVRGEHYNYPFLIDKDKNQVQPACWHWGYSNLVLIDELDFKILQELANDSRIPTKEIANTLKSTVSIVNYRIRKLINVGVITKFTINIDWSTLGYDWYHLQIYLNELSKKNQIMNYLRESPYLIRILKGFYFNVDIHSTFLFQNQNQLRELIENLTSRFPNTITKCNFYRTFKVYKHEYMLPRLTIAKNLLLLLKEHPEIKKIR